MPECRPAPDGAGVAIQGRSAPSLIAGGRVGPKSEPCIEWLQGVATGPGEDEPGVLAATGNDPRPGR